MVEAFNGPNQGGSVTILAGSGSSTGGGIMAITSGVSDDDIGTTIEGYQSFLVECSFQIAEMTN